jgi:hypothetical protein
MYYLTFNYGSTGYGPLTLFDNNVVAQYWACRTGSIDEHGKLKNAIAPGTWTGRECPVDTTEPAMIVEGIGWKFRLWAPDGRWTHYLIHPDGNKPGSLGCIVLPLTPAVDLRDYLKGIINEQKIINVIINQL